MTVTQSDLDEANSQIAGIKLAISKLTDQATIDALTESLKQIEEEARDYDYALNPRPKPEECLTCNSGPFIAMPDTTCANCGNRIVQGRVEDGFKNWIVHDGENVSLVIGEVPE